MIEKPFAKSRGHDVKVIICSEYRCDTVRTVKNGGCVHSVQFCRMLGMLMARISLPSSCSLLLLLSRPSFAACLLHPSGHYCENSDVPGLLACGLDLLRRELDESPTQEYQL